jgi:hypothetical protein
MVAHSDAKRKDYLKQIARRAMQKYGFLPDFSADALRELETVQRLVTKSAAALLLSSRIGDLFDAICTDAADKGTWVRIFQAPIEGRLLDGVEGVDVGDRLKVQLIRTHVEKGYLDFKKI